jgi:hypothetical protein
LARTVTEKVLANKWIQVKQQISFLQQ